MSSTSILGPSIPAVPASIHTGHLDRPTPLPTPANFHFDQGPDHPAVGPSSPRFHNHVLPDVQQAATRPSAGSKTSVDSMQPPYPSRPAVSPDLQGFQPPFPFSTGFIPPHLQQTAMAVLQVLAGANLPFLGNLPSPQPPFVTPPPSTFPPSPSSSAIRDVPATHRPGVCENAPTTNSSQNPGSSIPH